MNNRLFVGGLDWNTDSDGLRAAFERFGRVDEARVIMDRETGRSRGFGFVTYSNEAAAEHARQTMDGAPIEGRKARVNFAESKPQGQRPSGGGYHPGARRVEGDREGRAGEARPSQPEPVRSESTRPRAPSPDREFVDRSDVAPPRGNPEGGARPPRRRPASWED